MLLTGWNVAARPPCNSRRGLVFEDARNAIPQVGPRQGWHSRRRGTSRKHFKFPGQMALPKSPAPGCVSSRGEILRVGTKPGPSSERCPAATGVWQRPAFRQPCDGQDLEPRACHRDRTPAPSHAGNPACFLRPGCRPFLQWLSAGHGGHPRLRRTSFLFCCRLRATLRFWRQPPLPVQRQTERSRRQRREASRMEAVLPWLRHQAARQFLRRVSVQNRNVFAGRFPIARSSARK